MNAVRRKQLQLIAQRVETARGALDDIYSELDSVREDEQAYRDSVPEGMQQRIDKADVACTALDDACGEVEGARDTLAEALGFIEGACA